VTAHVKIGYNTDRVTKAILAKLETFKFPEGDCYVPAGEIESRQGSFGGLGTAILIAAFGVLATLVLEFRGFKSTLIVLSVVPLGVVGGLLLLLLTGNTLSFTSIVGFIALVGIEVKTSISLVDFTNQLRKHRCSRAKSRRDSFRASAVDHDDGYRRLAADCASRLSPVLATGVGDHRWTDQLDSTGAAGDAGDV
jgi:multidrug efflux pump subunit AcrB